MISWSATTSMLRHVNAGCIRIPLSSLFTNFKIDLITVHKDEIVINLLEKNHILLDGSENTQIKYIRKDGVDAE